MFIPQEERETTAAVEPPKDWRRLFIVRVRGVEWVDCETNGIPGPYTRDAIDEALLAMTGGRMMSDGSNYHPAFTVAQLLDLSVMLHQRHGWTLDSFTPTEARLWRLA